MRKKHVMHRIAAMILMMNLSLVACHPGNGGDVDVPPSPTTSEQLPWVSPVVEPEPTASPMPTATPTPVKTPSPWPAPTIPPDTVGLKSQYIVGNLFHKLFKGTEEISDYQSPDIISFGNPVDYSLLEGVTTFRGNHFRNSAAYGVRDVKEEKLEIIWNYGIGVIDNWPGVGWTGQPLLVHWPEDIRRLMNIREELKDKDLIEVIYATMDGNIYFLDLETGQPTRDSIHIGFPLKGTPSVDSRGYPVLYCGQGVNRNGDVYGSFQYRVFSLIDQSLLFQIPGSDPVSLRNWGAFDSSGLIDHATDTLIQCGENGLIYKVKLNTVFDKEAGTISMDPEILKYQYRGVFSPRIGIESSPAIYRNLLYVADNGGLLQCIDINTMQPVWIADLKDDTDSTIVIEETEAGVFLYTANEVDNRCVAQGTSFDYCNLRKFDALTGELIWQRDYRAVYTDPLVVGGALSTPVIGKNDISDLVIFNIAKTNTWMDGKLVALNKASGEEVWSIDLTYYSWSSPVDFLSSDGKTYMIFCDFNGDMHLIDPLVGRILDTVSLGRNVEGSPAIYGNTAVVGSYALKIFGVRIK